MFLKASYAFPYHEFSLFYSEKARKYFPFTTADYKIRKLTRNGIILHKDAIFYLLSFTTYKKSICVFVIIYLTWWAKLLLPDTISFPK